jgi:hypothetical protein
MKLFRLHAYSIVPARTADDEMEPRGGAIKPSAELRSAMDNNRSRAKFHKCTQVGFVVDPTSRTNDVRDDVMTYGFGEAASAKSAALRLATLLGRAMDRRSPPCLLVPAASQDGPRAQVILWIFPRDEAFILNFGREGPSMEVVSDAFSQRSNHRKAAAFEGKSLRTEFLTGRVLDHQVSRVSGEVADFWTNRFLRCALSVSNDGGTRMLARTVRKAHDSTDDPIAKEILQAAVVAVRHTPQPRMSLDTFASRYLKDAALETFEAVAPKEARADVFTFQRPAFDAIVQFQVFHLNTGVIVSSPMDQIGQSVKLSGSGNRTLSCSGTVALEQLRARHA